jgi:hypothetical protein
MTTEPHAITIATTAIDTVHGCHLNAERATVVDYLTDAAESMNADPDVAAYGIMPLPLGIIADDTTSTTVGYRDGSCIRFTWDADGWATSMTAVPARGVAFIATSGVERCESCGLDTVGTYRLADDANGAHACAACAAAFLGGVTA